MRKKEIEKRIQNTFSNSVPNVLDNILVKCEKEKGFKNMKNIQVETEKKTKNVFFSPKFIGALATIILVVLTTIGYQQYQIHKVDTIIEFDVNPSIILKVNKNNDIIKAKGLNEDGQKVLKDMDLDDVDLDVAINAIIGSMIKNGYLSIDANSILVSVKNDDNQKRTQLQTDISQKINEILSYSTIEGSILSQDYSDSKDIKSIAEKYNITEGKAQLISNILASNLTNSKGEAYTEDALVNLSINELNLLLTEKNTSINSVKTEGSSASESGYIGRDKAKEIAFNHANVNERKVTNIEIELDADDGRLIYEVEFDYQNQEYEYDINAKTGDIIFSNFDYDDDHPETTSSNEQTNTNFIGEAKAKEIAFNHAKVSASDIKNFHIELDEDDNRYIYEIEFRIGNKEYKYDINAITGDIRDYEIDWDD